MSATISTARRPARPCAAAAPAAPMATYCRHGGPISSIRRRRSWPPRLGSWCAAITNYAAAADRAGSACSTRIRAGPTASIAPHRIEDRPAQLIAGVGGSKLQELGHAPIAGAELDGMAVRDGIALARFGYLVLDRNPEGGWDGVLYAPDDTVLARCKIGGRNLDCR